MNGSGAQRVIVQPTAPPRPHPGRLERRARPARVQLTDRDQELFRSLAVHRLLTSDQLHRLHFPRAHPRRVRRRLRQLFDARLLDRIAAVAQPQHGVPPFVYALTRDSAGLAAADLGRDVSLPAAHGSSLRFIAHHVGVCGFYVALWEAVQRTDWTIGEWRHEWELRVHGESGTARAERIDVTDPDTRQEKRLGILPDAYFTLTGRPGTLHFFFEFDRSTHALSRWRERALAFTAYERQGRFRRRFGGDAFRVLVVTRPDFRQRSRCQNIAETIERAVGPTELFLLAKVNDVEATTIFDAIWRQPGSKTRRSPFGPSASRRPVVRVVPRARPA